MREPPEPWRCASRGRPRTTRSRARSTCARASSMALICAMKKSRSLNCQSVGCVDGAGCLDRIVRREAAQVVVPVALDLPEPEEPVPPPRRRADGHHGLERGPARREDQPVHRAEVVPDERERRALREAVAPADRAPPRGGAAPPRGSRYRSPHRSGPPATGTGQRAARFGCPRGASSRASDRNCVRSLRRSPSQCRKRMPARTAAVGRLDHVHLDRGVARPDDDVLCPHARPPFGHAEIVPPRPMIAA